MSNFKGLDVLIVDDDELSSSALRHILKRLKLNVSIAENGVECLREIALKDYDLIFMDYQMPVMDGKTAAREIRKSRLSDVPIITITGSVHLSEKELKEYGFDDWLIKPYRREDIVRLLDEFILR